MDFATLQGRIMAMIDQMKAAGMSEDLVIFTKQGVMGASGEFVARQRVQAGTLSGYVIAQSGQEMQAQEGSRIIAKYAFYFVPQPGDALSEANYSVCWVQMPRRHGAAFCPIADYQTVGPYAILSINYGGTNDPAGNLK